MKEFFKRHKALSVILCIPLFALAAAVVLALWHFGSNRAQLAKTDQYDVKSLSSAVAITITEEPDGATAQTSRAEDIEAMMRCIKRLRSNLIFAIPNVMATTLPTNVVFTFEDGSTAEYSYRSAAVSLGNGSPFSEFYGIPYIAEQLEASRTEP